LTQSARNSSQTAVIDLQLDQDMPPELQPDQDMPPELQTEQDMPPVLQLDQDMPPELQIDQDVPSDLQLYQDVPSDLQLYQDVPSDLQLDQDIPPDLPDKALSVHEIGEQVVPDFLNNSFQFTSVIFCNYFYGVTNWLLNPCPIDPIVRR
jgi:hypothetical protein